MIGKTKATLLVKVPEQCVFTKGRAAQYLGISVKTLLKRAADGEIPMVDDHGRKGFRLKDLDRHVDSFKPWQYRTEPQ